MYKVWLLSSVQGPHRKSQVGQVDFGKLHTDGYGPKIPPNRDRNFGNFSFYLFLLTGCLSHRQIFYALDVADAGGFTISILRT